MELRRAVTHGRPDGQHAHRSRLLPEVPHPAGAFLALETQI